eukprot:2350894-Prymnesium_polylepis.1
MLCLWSTSAQWGRHGDGAHTQRVQEREMRREQQRAEEVEKRERRQGIRKCTGATSFAFAVGCVQGRPRPETPPAQDLRTKGLSMTARLPKQDPRPKTQDRSTAQANRYALLCCAVASGNQ